MVGVVDDVGGESELGELVDAVGLEGSGFFAGGFDFGECGSSSWHEDESVGHSGEVGAGEF
ncbi:hypothetical protein I6H48_06180 [Corynebacterium amycolatum]|uniref:Uncharacterized protein n=1 Tax=Corynebacterium amycolatum TaxID=43765 RepID=A0A7T4G7L2_CORAY|nr:hypothetical protein [Corynebacterium amycolatum]QQB83763.1 hypothetical protein I6H48_06180 [Corynebacterium amycolatum]